MGIFGSISRALFGGSKQKSSSKSWNEAYPFLTERFGGMTSRAGQGTDALADLLGLGGEGEHDAAFKNYLGSTDYEFIRDQAMRGVKAMQAAKGNYQSGATLKALQDRGAQVARGYYDNYLNKLLGLSGLGLQAGGLIAGAGGRSESKGKGTSSEGIGSSLGAILALASLSDKRAKTDIRKVGELDDGQPVFRYRYRHGGPVHIGLIAQEVEKTRPEAVITLPGGVKMVNYLAATRKAA